MAPHLLLPWAAAIEGLRTGDGEAVVDAVSTVQAAIAHDPTSAAHVRDAVDRAVTAWLPGRDAAVVVNDATRLLMRVAVDHPQMLTAPPIDTVAGVDMIVGFAVVAVLAESRGRDGTDALTPTPYDAPTRITLPS